MNLSAILHGHGLGAGPSPKQQLALATRNRLRDIAQRHGLDGNAIARSIAREAELWADCSDETLLAYAIAFTWRRERAANRRPASWTAVAHCRRCGPIWIWPDAPAELLACPWCEFSRDQNIPRPSAEELEHAAREAPAGYLANL